MLRSFYSWFHRLPPVAKALVTLACAGAWFGFAVLAFYVTLSVMRAIPFLSANLKTLLTLVIVGLVAVAFPLRIVAKLDAIGRSFGVTMRGVANRPDSTWLLEPDPATEHVLADLGHGDGAYEQLLTGSLVARVRYRRDMPCRSEYLRRLCYLGFTKNEALSLLVREFDALDLAQRDDLIPEDGMTRPLFSATHCPFTLNNSVYLVDGMETCSHIVKAADEAERLYAQGRDPQMRDLVWKEVASLAEPDGHRRELLDQTLARLAKTSGVPLEKVQRYAQAERQLLARCRWGEDVDHPYLVAED